MGMNAESHFGFTEKHCEGDPLHEVLNARQAMRKAQAERNYTHLGDEMSLEAAIDAAAASEENYYFALRNFWDAVDDRIRYATSEEGW